jgi:hypothetical protein
MTKIAAIILLPGRYIGSSFAWRGRRLRDQQRGVQELHTHHHPSQVGGV